MDYPLSFHASKSCSGQHDDDTPIGVAPMDGKRAMDKSTP